MVEASITPELYASSPEQQLQLGQQDGRVLLPFHFQLVLKIAIAAYSIITLAIFCGRSKLIQLAPKWLRPFAAEEVEDDHKRRKWSFWTLLLGAISLAGLTLSLVPILLIWSSKRALEPLMFLEVVPWFVATLMVIIGRPTTAPRLLFTIFIFMSLEGLGSLAIRLIFLFYNDLSPLELAGNITSILGYLAIGNMPLRDPSWSSSDIGKPGSTPTVKLRSPEDNLTIFQFWTMTWIYPLARVCRRREINVEDVWQLPFEFQHKRLYLAFKDVKGKLLSRLVQANGLDLAISVLLSIIEKVAEVSSIRLTSNLYGALDNSRPNQAVVWCLAMLCVDMIRQISKTTGSWYSRKAYERSRGETFIGLFGKLLTRAVAGSDLTETGPEEDGEPPKQEDPEATPTRLSRFLSLFRRRKRYSQVAQTPVQDQPASNAKVVNLVRGDTYEISQRFWDFPKLISRPIKVIFTMYYLIDIMGWPSCVGFGLMVIFLFINSLLVRELIRLERLRTAHSDKRAQSVAHFVEASRPLKLNGWTSSWSGRIMRFRAMEMLRRLHISYCTAAIGTINVLGGACYPLASITLFTLFLGRGLPNQVIWPSLQLFAQLEGSVREAFDLISAYWKTTIPVERVHKYMDEPDRDEKVSSEASGGDIIFKDATFAWPATEKPVLQGLDLRFPPGLTLIRGKVGSGKSSLLLAALNEMRLLHGDLIRPDESIGYAQQFPWLQNKTIRENIVFHQRFDHKRYQEVIRACALKPDLETFPASDLTKLEEGGIGLSGGQKARVALARAVYSDCRILLLDDPLAALDHDTASTIVRRFLQGPLAKDRTIVMVTHRDELVLRIADQVINVDEGRATILGQEQIKRDLEHPLHLNDGKTVAEHGEEPVEHHEDDATGLEDPPEEPSETGSVSISVYTKYMKAGGWYLWVTLAMAYALSRYCDIARAQLLEAWGNQTTSVSTTANGRFWNLPSPDDHPRIWLSVLSAISGGQIVTYGIAQILLAHICVNAAQGLFKIAIDRVSKATFRYHDITPTSQLKNRLIADMGMVDGGILAPLEGFVYNLIALFLSLGAIMLHQPELLIVVGAVALVFVYFFRIFVPVSRCLRRMEMRYLTPIISNIGVMQDGLVTIRALRVEDKFQERHLLAVDDFQKQDHFFWSMNFWLDYRLGCSSLIMQAVLILYMIFSGAPASAVGFVLTQTNIAIPAVQQLCEKFAQLQLDAISLERVEMLSRIPEEPNGDEMPPENWPRPEDDVSFENMSFKYDEHLEEVLHEVSFKIPGGSTCAVLGRTGSGKSTVANALLATQLPSRGTVSIGKFDLSKIDRPFLRNRITFVQQDPILFPGTLRDNLDPEGKFTESECQWAIERVLGPDWHIDSHIDAGGKNISQGQRQLVSIGRAVLRRSGLVILDEATASIDRETAAKAQRILREELAESTVITIAHRLEAVEDANWSLRLDRGRVVECGPA